MSGPTEFCEESVRQFMLANGGRVTNHELVKHFKQVQFSLNFTSLDCNVFSEFFHMKLHQKFINFDPSSLDHG